MLLAGSQRMSRPRLPVWESRFSSRSTQLPLRRQDKHPRSGKDSAHSRVPAQRSPPPHFLL